jgi:iron(III) transport system permease protein
MGAAFDSSKLLFYGVIVSVLLFLSLFVLFPLADILVKSFQDSSGTWVWMDNFIYYLSQANSIMLIKNSLFVASLSTFIVIPVAFTFAYAITRTLMPLKPVIRYIALIPLLAPSLLPAISFIYIFGNQGFLKEWMGDGSIYGLWGVVMGECFYVFPHALMILITALSLSDGRLYEAAGSMGASKFKQFMSITLPSAKYGLISAMLVTFTLVITDFGVPKVIGGDYALLATEIYKQVIGQQNFELGATVGVLLLIPSVVTFVVDGLIQKKQRASLSAKSVAYYPKKWALRDYGMLGFTLIICGLLLSILGVAIYASFVKFWPYNLDLVLSNYNFEMMDGGGWDSYYNSLKMATLVAIFGTIIVFISAYVVERSKVARPAINAIKMLALLPMAVPGLVLGLGYIFFFNHPDNPLGFMYQSLAILVVCTIAHFFTPSFITVTTTLKQIDREFEDVGESMSVPFYITFFRVTVPISIPSIIEITRYFFVNAMTTVSVVVFLYSPDTTLAAVAVLNMDEAGDISAAAAMATLIVATSFVATMGFALLSRGIVKATQSWRKGR